MEKVLEFIRNNTSLNHNDYVVIGLSGGPDSMFLLHQLLKYQQEVKFNIVCAHVHHNLRKESDDEALFVEKYCRDNNVIFEMTKFNYEGTFSEALGHNMRYEYFDTIVKKYGAKYLFTAHHGDDLVETILMRMVRGSSFNGYKGFNRIVFRDNYVILRPLVEVTKEDILNYLKACNIPYVIDNSNNDVCYTRNRFRKYLLPKLKEEDSNVHLKFLKFSNMLNDYNNFVEKQVNNIYNDIVKNDVINISKLKELDSLLINHIINKWLKNIYGDNITLVNDKHVDNILNVIYNSKPNISISLPNYDIVKSYNQLYVKSINKEINYEYILNEDVILPNGKSIIIVESSNLTSNYVTYLNSEDFNIPLYVRNYRPGDKMTIKNMNGHKKIKDIFINEKITLENRINQPVVVDSSGEIVWLPGIKKSAFDSQNSAKYDIILEYH